MVLGWVVGSGKGGSEISDRRNDVRHSTVRFTVLYQNLVRFMFSSPLWILPKSLKSTDGNRQRRISEQRK